MTKSRQGAAMEKIPLVAVVGPTASGKTRLAIDICLKYGGEVVSADSMQVYTGMDIGTAKPGTGEMKGVAHHMLDIADPREPFSVADYVKMARNCIGDVFSRTKLPVLAGGTGLYINSVVDNINYTETKSDFALRERLSDLAQKKGGEALLEILREFDPEAAGQLHPNNTGRIIRAIEVYKLSGITMSEARRRSRLVPSPYRLCMIGLHFSDRELLYGRINERVDAMLSAGLADEVKRLLDSGVPENSTAMQAIGYKELSECLRGESSIGETAEAVKQATRHYAKRQMTWFRRDTRINWLDAGKNYENMCRAAFDIIDNSGIL